jgi:kynurenine formamidase
MILIDLTHKFTADMPVYPGDTKPELKEVSTVEKDGFGHFWISTGMHVGTHIDAPLHFIAGGKKLSEFPIEKFIGRGVLIDARDNAIDSTLLKESAIQKGDIVLIWTDVSRRFRDADYYTNTPVLTEEFARALVAAGVKMVGMDMNGPDKEPFSVHKILLGSDILIAENLTGLEQLAQVKEFEVIALPVKFDAEAALARVVARIM